MELVAKCFTVRVAMLCLSDRRPVVFQVPICVNVTHLSCVQVCNEPCPMCLIDEQIVMLMPSTK